MKKIKRYDYPQKTIQTKNNNFAKIISSAETVKEAILELDRFKNSKNKTSIDSSSITTYLEEKDVVKLRETSIYFDGVSGVYGRLIKYMAGILTYDFMVLPYLVKTSAKKKTVEQVEEVLRYADSLKLKTVFYNISVKVLTEGAYYGYLINNKSNTIGGFLELPIKYCRSRYEVNGMDAVEFNLKYFDDMFKDDIQKTLVINSFPKEFSKAYELYKSGGIPMDKDDRGYWFLCDPALSMRFSLNSLGIPLFVAAIPSIVTLEEAKQIDMKKTIQELLKVVIQKMPLDKNGELIFDMEEAADMHNNAVRMLDGAVNVDILTTFADVEMLDLDNSTNVSATSDSLKKVERGVFNEAGVSQMLFATDGNLSLEKSILNDESIMFYLLSQYENKLNGVIDYYFNAENVIKIRMPEHSIYNRAAKQKMYETAAKAGYSVIMAAIAMGHTQSEFLSILDYESALGLKQKMAPLQISSTQSSKNSSSSDKQVGAPKKSADEVTEKTISNQESKA